MFFLIFVEMGQRLVPDDEFSHLFKYAFLPVEGAQCDVPHTSNHRVVAGIHRWHEIARSVLLSPLHSHGKTMSLFIFFFLVYCVLGVIQFTAPG